MAAFVVGGVKKLIRKKVYTGDDVHVTDLRRCLTTLDLIGLGTGSTLGAGIYILSGQVAKDTAGPAVVISFLVSGIAAALAGLCYAEFAARVPRAGSAYVYSYVTVGELMAFVIGWNVLLEYVINVASVARSLSAYVDYLLDKRMEIFFRTYLPISVPGFAPYPDLFAFTLILIITVFVALGVKESTRLNNAFTVVNIAAIAFIIIAGFVKSDIHNWELTKDEVPPEAGDGGFAPFGFSGIMSGAATCFFAYVGFDFIASMGEEALNPTRDIPVAMMSTLLVNLLCYGCVAAVVNLMCPYFLLDSNAPVAYAFEYVGWGAAKYAITIGAICGMSSSVTGGLFPMSRIVYAMASDGLIFRWLAYVSPRFQTPIIGTLIMGFFSALMTLLLDLTELIHMLSIGTLLAFALVAVCVLILRFKVEAVQVEDKTRGNGSVVKEQASCFKLSHLFKSCSGTPTPSTARIAETALACMCVFQTALAVFVTAGYEPLLAGEGWAVGGTVVTSLLALTAFLVLACQPQNSDRHLAFTVPLVPLLPSLSFLTNVYLMCKLNDVTWIRFAVWMTAGFCMYFFYGIRKSSLNDTSGESKPLCFNSESQTMYTTTPSAPPAYPHNGATSNHLEKDGHANLANSIETRNEEK